MPGDFCVRRQDYRTAEGYIMGAENKEQGMQALNKRHKEMLIKFYGAPGQIKTLRN